MNRRVSDEEFDRAVALGALTLGALGATIAAMVVALVVLALRASLGHI